jgi:hypothetical protein
MTFSLPEAVAAQFLRQVPSRERSRFVSEALSVRLAERDRMLIAACDAANADPDVAELQKDFDIFDDEMAERWR